MPSAVPRRVVQRSTQVSSLPSDRTPDRRAAAPITKQTGASYARPRYLTAEEREADDRARADARGNLAAMCFERTGVDLLADPDEVKASPEAVAGKLDFLLLAEALGLDGAR